MIAGRWEQSCRPCFMPEWIAVAHMAAAIFV